MSEQKPSLTRSNSFPSSDDSHSSHSSSHGSVKTFRSQISAVVDNEEWHEVRDCFFLFLKMIFFGGTFAFSITFLCNYKQGRNAYITHAYTKNKRNMHF
mmetsp:Transcript_61104/g.90647  ORF Transcript_61104/g.90647 Transcript_61104/m.90647 type:complete len:99 (-) Transcript_61104:542-838(-)